MSLGEKLRQARQEAGLSQRALCGDVITRNMLSQIENGLAQPSMATLQYLAGQLGKPVGYFLGEATDAQQPPLGSAIAALERTRHLIAAGKPQEAGEALAQAELSQAPTWVKRQQLLLQAQLTPDRAHELASQLPSLDGELLLRARAALAQKDPQRAAAYLAAAQENSPQWQLLMGEALLVLEQYPQAAEHFHQAEEQYPHRTSQALEICYRELEDYQKAYFYACRVRNLTGR